MASTEPAILLFDGACNLCARSVQFVLRRDPLGRVHFAPLQSAAAAAACARIGAALPQAVEPDSVLLIQGGRLWERSDAVLAVARLLRFPWPVLVVLRVVPRCLRDAAYGWIARHRYRWFGRSATCLVPRPEWRARFLVGWDRPHES